MQTAYLLPLTVLFLALAVVALGFRARRRRGYGPLAVGVAAGAVLVVGKFVIDSDLAVYAGVAGLVGASLWNSWPVTSTAGVPSAPAGTLYQIGSIDKEK
jgi:lipopolysaccharide export LptBFGC system permease protein LptF